MENNMCSVSKYLKKKKEEIIVSLNISNYNKKNIYLALVYNKNISRYKILYIPFDLIDDCNIEDYACYQFIDIETVGYILETFDEMNESNCFSKVVDNRYSDTAMYGIEINIRMLNYSYKLLATRYIPKDWQFLFEVILLMFSYAPNNLGGLVEEILTLFKDGAEDILYQDIFEFDLFKDDISKLENIYGTSRVLSSKLNYLEEVNGKYFAVIDKKIVIVNYDSSGVLSIYCSDENRNGYVLTVLEAIKNGKSIPFSKLSVTNKETKLVQYYLCYDVDEEGIKVIHGCSEKMLPFELYTDGSIKFIEDINKIEDKIKIFVQ